MMLTQEELQSLAELKQRSPHQLLSMHPLGDGLGVVARAFLPDAATVELEPAHEKDKPTITLNRIPKTDIFEGTTKEANRVYAYDLVITDRSGKVRRTRDPYSFLPTLGEADLFLPSLGRCGQFGERSRSFVIHPRAEAHAGNEAHAAWIRLARQRPATRVGNRARHPSVRRRHDHA